MAFQDGVNRAGLPTYDETVSHPETKPSVHFNPQPPSFIPLPPSPPPPPGFHHPNFSSAYYQPHADLSHQTSPAVVHVTAVPEQPPQTIIYRIKSRKGAFCSSIISLIILIIFIVVLVKVIIPAFNRIQVQNAVD
ncbi:uncharacterized protein LOC116425022 [Nomia melanderi]|uniref:uncharacterized protein LOC116425022 n=1 Tax=Nomia melanderi TaxID=2448451 RepID=UPI0013044618|nr:uncharacterized protein LOC116425022 [Nomia melanderi]